MNQSIRLAGFLFGVIMVCGTWWVFDVVQSLAITMVWLNVSVFLIVITILEE